MQKRSALHEYIDMMERWKERTYLVGCEGYRSERWSFGRVRETALGFSGALQKTGLHKGQRVILGGRPGPEWVSAFFAVLHRGGVVVPVDPGCSFELTKKIVERTDPTHIVGDIIGELPTDSIRKLCRTAELFPFSALKDHAGGPPGSAEKVSPEDLAEVVFTSGTTGNPKGVMLTHGNILANLRPIEQGLEKRKMLVQLLTPLKILCTVPYSHMFGQVSGILLPILIGSTIYYARDTAPASLVREIRKNRVITLITVPRIMKLLKDHFLSWLLTSGRSEGFWRRYERWVKLPYPLRVPFYLDIHRFFGLSFWSFIVGGAPLDPDTHEFWRRLVYAVFQGYGLTETSPIVTMFNPFQDHRSSVGRIFPNQEVRIAADGEILVKGSNVMAGYYEAPEETGSVLRDGWLSTGDIGTIDEKGQLFIRGRKKDMIVTPDGRNVFTGDVEEALNRIDGVRESYVFGIPADGGEAVHAVLLLDEGTDPDEVVTSANRELLPFQRIRGYTVWEDPDFPRTSTLKVRRAEVEEHVLLKKGPETKSHLLDGLLPGSVDPDMRLVEDLGLDSLDRIELVSRLEREYGTSLDESSIGPGTTLRDLEKLARHPKPARKLNMPRWTLSAAARFFRKIAMHCFILQAARIFCPLHVEGLERLEAERGERIIISNHQSHIDPFAILLALPRRYRRLLAPAMGLNRFGARFTDFASTRPGSASRFRVFLHALAYFIVTLLFQTYPFPQGAAFRPSLEYTGELLDRGHWILIFPEGEVSPDGKVRSFKKGISMIAERTGADILPVSIDGMNRVLPPESHFPRRARVKVRFGSLIRYEGEGYEKFAKLAENAVRALHETPSLYPSPS
jgi:long-chain acyl-CoA synthetase